MPFRLHGRSALSAVFTFRFSSSSGSKIPTDPWTNGSRQQILSACMGLSTGTHYVTLLCCTGVDMTWIKDHSDRPIGLLKILSKDDNHALRLPCIKAQSRLYRTHNVASSSVKLGGKSQGRAVSSNVQRKAPIRSSIPALLRKCAKVYSLPSAPSNLITQTLGQSMGMQPDEKVYCKTGPRAGTPRLPYNELPLVFCLYSSDCHMHCCAPSSTLATLLCLIIGRCR